MPPSCALLGGFAMEVRVALLWQQRKREMLASTCFYVCILALCVVGNICSLFFVLITFCVSRRRRKMYYGHARLCVCLPVRAAVRPHYCTDPDVTWGCGRGCPLVVYYWADLQSVHRLRCYGNRTRTLVYAGCARCRPVTGG